MSKILARSAWTTTPNKRANRPLDPKKVNAITIHYPADGNVKLAALSKDDVAKRLSGYRNHHVNNRKWVDIGYNYAIDGSGRIWFLTGMTVGAHANKAGNPTSVGVLFVLGNKEKPTQAQINAFKDLRAHVLKTLPKATKVQGHQQVPGNNTSCPGAEMMKLIKSGELTKPAIELNESTQAAELWQASSSLLLNCQSKAKDWKKRAPILAQIILKSDASFILLQELYAKQRPDLENLIKTEYARAAVRSGRVIYYRKDRWKPVGAAFWQNMGVGSRKKPAVARKFERIDNGVRVNIINVHLSYELTAAGIKARKAETRNIVTRIQKNFPKDRRIFGGDWNSPAGSTTRKDDVGPIMAEFGYKDFGRDPKPKIGKGHYHLDRKFGSTESVKGTKNTVTQHAGSDHPAVFVKFKFKVK